MFRIILFSGVVLWNTGPLCQADEPALSLGASGGSGGDFAWSQTNGWEFEVKQPVTVTQLGVFDEDSNGLSIDIPVGIWNPAGELVASGIVPAGNRAKLEGQFRYVSIDPVSLPSGRQYFIGALYTPHSRETVISSNAGVEFTTLGPITWLRARHGRSDELSLPPGTDSHYDEAPGCFGPNFVVEEDDASIVGHRTFYTTREVQLETRHQTVAVPVEADGSHSEIHPPQVSLFAAADGKLTQVVIDGRPLGIGSTAFEKLASESLRLDQESHVRNTTGQQMRAIPQIFYTPHVRASDLQTAMHVAHYLYFKEDSWPRSGRGCEVLSLYDGRLKQREHEGRFVDPERFCDSGEFVEDRWTGLLWQKDGGIAGTMTFEGAAAYAQNIELSGLRGWRVPTRDEFCTIFPATFAPFTETKYNPSSQRDKGSQEFPCYWTSDLDLRVAKDYAYIYQWYGNGGGNNCYTSNLGYVRCVRDASRE